MAEPTPKLTKVAARDLTKRIGGLMGELEDLVILAWRGYADEALGYASWDEYVHSEIPDLPRFNLPKRQEAVKKLTEGTAQTERGQMTANEVASTLGVSKRTVEADRASITGSSNRKTAVPRSAAKKTTPPPPVVKQETEKPDLSAIVAEVVAAVERLKDCKFADLNGTDKRRIRTAYKILVGFIGAS